jgi:hypothetical protein
LRFSLFAIAGPLLSRPLAITCDELFLRVERDHLSVARLRIAGL